MIPDEIREALKKSLHKFWFVILISIFCIVAMYLSFVVLSQTVVCKQPEINCLRTTLEANKS